VSRLNYNFDFSEDEHELDEWYEQMRQERVAKGLPPDPPEAFVPMPLTCVLLERIWPLREIVIKYALLVHQSKKVLPIDAGELRRKYEKDLLLLGQSVGMISGMTGTLLRQAIDEIEIAQQESSAEVAEGLAKSLYVKLEISVSVPSLGDLNIEESVEDRAEYKRLKSDEALIQSELDKYFAEYESIRYLI
jgi:hypothetical protein